VLFGRERELNDITETLARAASGAGGGGLLVIGGPGSGKSSLLAATAHMAGDDARVVAIEASPSPLPWDVFDSLWRPLSSSKDDLDPSHAAALHSFGAGMCVRPSVEVAAQSLLALWAVAARQRPLLVLLDDFDRVDAPSREVLEALAGHLQDVPVVLVCATRPRRDTRNEGFAGFERRLLRNLTEVQARLLVRDRLGAAVSPSVVAHLVARTAGNPLGLAEAIEMLDDEVLQGLAPLPRPLPCGPGVRASFGAPLAPLSEAARRAIAMVALCGGDTIRLKGAAGALGVDDDALAEAAAHGVIADLGSFPTLTHPLFGAAALAMLDAHDADWIRAAVAAADGDPLLADGAMASDAQSWPAPAPSVPDASAVVQLLGGFSVVRGGLDCTPRGTAALLVKDVALRGRVHIDVVVEDLWPEAAPGAGRVRLRNVLSRARTVCGDLVLRDGDFLCLSEDTLVDAAEAERLFTEILAGAGMPLEKLRSRALAAVAAYRGELLPADRYIGWAAASRERLTRRYLAVLGVLADLHRRAGDREAAVAVLEEALDLDRYEQRTYLQAAELLAEGGATAKALVVLREAMAACAELGLSPAEEILRLHRRLDACHTSGTLTPSVPA
jgi:DNA-binding SARP family transcriptional activator